MDLADARFGAETISLLHVDDDPDLADLAAEFLEREDDRIAVDTATNASDGLEQIADCGYDCIVSDYEMPGMDGIEFLEAVREDYPDLPFILFTGKGSEEIASEAISAGVTDYLQKETGTGQYTVLANRVTNAVEKYRAQVDLSDSKDRLALFFEQSPFGVIEWDESFAAVQMNEAAEEILGYDEAEFAGTSWEQIVPPSDRADVEAVVADLLDDHGGYHSVNANTRKNGERIVCEWHNRVVTDDEEVVAIFSQFRDVTDRRRQERRFEAIFDNTYTFAGLMEPDGTLLEANETALSFGGLDREDVVGKPLWESYWVESNPEGQATVREAVEQAREGTLYRDEIRIQGSDRDAVIDFSVRPITDERGNVTLLVPEGRDITDQREPERSQTRSAKFEALYENSPDLIDVLDSDGIVLDANQRFCEALGYDEAALVGTPIWDIDREVDKDDVDDLLGDLAVGERRKFEGRYERRDGSTLPVEVHLLRVTLDDEDRFLAISRDITERKAQERKRAQIIERVTDAIVEVDEEWRFTLVNEQAEVIYDMDEAELLGESFWDVFSGALGTRFEEEYRQVMETREPTSFVEYYPELDGWFDIQAYPKADGGVAFYFVEVTELRQYQRDLERKNARLEEFASVVSHDLRNPLNVAEGRLELAREECASDHLDDAVDAIGRSQALIDDLLTLAREGEDIGEVDRVALGDLVEECWQTVETGAATLQVRTEQTILANESRLQQALENLVRNAVEHGGADVTVMVGSLADGFYVADDGPGIPEGKRDRVFEAGHSTLDGEGSLGLAIVERIVTAHGWDIRATESESGGARFEISGVETPD